MWTTGFEILQLGLKEMHSTHLLDQKDHSHSAFWWATLTVNITFFVKKKTPQAPFKFNHNTLRSVTKVPSWSYSCGLLSIELVLVFSWLWNLPSSGASPSSEDYGIMCDWRLVSPSKNKILSPKRDLCCHWQKQDIYRECYKESVLHWVTHHTNSLSCTCGHVGESSAEDWEGCRRWSD